MDIDTMEAGPGMDSLVAAVVMNVAGFRVLESPKGFEVRRTMDARSYGKDAEPYSTWMSAAWKVVEEFRGRGFGFYLDANLIEGGWDCYFYTPDTDIVYAAERATAPEAICRAALKAALRRDHSARTPATAPSPQE